MKVVVFGHEFETGLEGIQIEFVNLMLHLQDTAYVHDSRRASFKGLGEGQDFRSLMFRIDPDVDMAFRPFEFEVDGVIFRFTRARIL